MVKNPHPAPLSLGVQKGPRHAEGLPFTELLVFTFFAFCWKEAKGFQHRGVEAVNLALMCAGGEVREGIACEHHPAHPLGAALQPLHPLERLGEGAAAPATATSACISVLPPVHGGNNVLDCCLRTKETPIPWRIVQDYRLQLVQDGCNIPATV